MVKHSKRLPPSHANLPEVSRDSMLSQPWQSATYKIYSQYAWSRSKCQTVQPGSFYWQKEKVKERQVSDFGSTDLWKPLSSFAHQKRALKPNWWERSVRPTSVLLLGAGHWRNKKIKQPKWVLCQIICILMHSCINMVGYFYYFP